MNLRESAVQYAQAGLSLVPVPFASKKPKEVGWNQSENLICDPQRAAAVWGRERLNVGVHLGKSGLCSFDPDELAVVASLLEQTSGVDAVAMLDAGWRVSGSPTSGRAIFRVPDGISLEYLSYSIPPEKAAELGVELTEKQCNDGNTINILELRAGERMDVLPPSIHPDTRKPYRGSLIPLRLTDIPELPAELLDLWQNFDSYKRAFDLILGIAAPEPKVAKSQSREVDLQGRGALDVAAAFSELREHDFDALLAAHGYEQQGSKWVAPGSTTELAGVMLLRDERRILSFHRSDKLGDGRPHDLFDCWRILEHAGNWQSAIAAARRELGWDAQAFDVIDAETEEQHLTDYGNALRLAELAAGRVRYVAETKSWLRWTDGGGWVLDEGSVWLTKLASSLAGLIISRELPEARSDEDRRKLFNHALKTQQRKTIDDCLNILSRFEGVRITVNALDANPLMVGIDAGRSVVILDGKDGWEVRQATPQDYATKSLGVAQIGDEAKAVRWHQFLAEVFEGDIDLIQWIQQFCGYLLSGLTSEQFLLFLFGSGANGKSVFIRVLQRLMGEYAVNVESTTLEAKPSSSGGASEDLARLKGARAAFTTETSNRSAFNEGLIKSLTGGDRITARHLYSHLFEFDPTHKFLIAGNHKPRISGTDDGIWRRMRLIPFTASFLGSKADPALESKLVAELEHIAAWALNGWDNYRMLGSLASVPARVVAATAEYRDAEDLLGEWLAERCELNPAEFTSRKKAHADYTQWCVDNNIYALGNRNFIESLSRPGFVERRFRGERGFYGFKLKDERSQTERRADQARDAFSSVDASGQSSLG